MEQSILKSTKKILGVAPDDPSFDLDIMTHINTAFSNLHDLGLGPIEGFIIEDDTKVWADFFENDVNHVWMSKVKNVVYMRVRMLFDPPSTQYMVDAMQKQIQEQEWRLNANREAERWVDPDPPRSADGTSDKEVIIADGGDVF